MNLPILYIVLNFCFSLPSKKPSDVKKRTPATRKATRTTKLLTRMTTTTTKVQTSTWTGTWLLTCRKPGPVRRISTRLLSVWLNHRNLLQFRNQICVNFTTNSSIHLIFIFRIQYVNLIFCQATSPPTTSSCKRRSAAWLQVLRLFGGAAELKAKLRRKKFGQKMETCRYKPSFFKVFVAEFISNSW